MLVINSDANLFALYVYLTMFLHEFCKEYFSDLTSGIMGVDGYADSMQTIYESAKLRNTSVDLTTTNTSEMKNYLIDIIYRLSDKGWDSLSNFLV